MPKYRPNKAGHPLPAPDQTARCDGCGITIAEPRPDQEHLIPGPIAREVHGEDPGSLVYVICDRGTDCLTLALLYDELQARVRCTKPRCTHGPGCTDPALPAPGPGDIL